MASKREQVIDAVVDLLSATFPDATVSRNEAKPEKIGPAGVVIVRDGDPGDPEITMCPLTYIYDHRIEVQIAVNRKTNEDADSALDDMLAQLGAAIETDHTLGGLCDFIQAEAPAIDPIEATGAIAARSGETAIIATYGTTNPLT